MKRASCGGLEKCWSRVQVQDDERAPKLVIDLDFRNFFLPVPFHR